MRNQATTLFNKRLHALRKEKIIIISLYLMVISWSFYLFCWVHLFLDMANG